MFCIIGSNLNIDFPGTFPQNQKLCRFNKSVFESLTSLGHHCQLTPLLHTEIWQILSHLSLFPQHNLLPPRRMCVLWAKLTIIFGFLPVWSCIFPMTPSTKPKHTGFHASNRSVAGTKNTKYAKRAARGQVNMKRFSQDNYLIFNTTHAGINKVDKFQQLLNNTWLYCQYFIW